MTEAEAEAEAEDQATFAKITMMSAMYYRTTRLVRSLYCQLIETTVRG